MSLSARVIYSNIRSGYTGQEAADVIRTTIDAESLGFLPKRIDDHSRDMSRDERDLLPTRGVAVNCETDYREHGVFQRRISGWIK